MYQKAEWAVQIKTPSPLPRVGFLRSEHRSRRGRADIGARWSARLRVWDAVFLRRQMRDLGRVGSELRNSSPRFLKGALKQTDQDAECGRQGRGREGGRAKDTEPSAFREAQGGPSSQVPRPRLPRHPPQPQAHPEGQAVFLGAASVGSPP